MDQETRNWFRVAKLLTDVGANVVRQLLYLLIRTSCLNIYVDCWLKHVKDRCYPNCLYPIMSALTTDCNNFDDSTKQIHQSLLRRWRGTTGYNTMRLYQQIQTLEEMELNVKDHLKVNHKQLFSLTKWLNRIKSEKVKQVDMLNQLTKWHKEFTDCISVSRKSLLNHMEFIQKQTNDLLASIQKSLSELTNPSIQDVKDLVQSWQNDLSMITNTCNGELTKFYTSWLPKLGNLVDIWKLNLGNTFNLQNLQIVLIDLQKELPNLHSSCNSTLQTCCKTWFQDLQNIFCNWQQKLLTFQGSANDLQSLILMLRQDIQKTQSLADKQSQEFFKSNNVDLNRLRKRNVLNESQWLLLFPSSGCPVLTSFDITLSYTLLRNIGSICPPQQGWNEKLSDTDLSTGADLERLKFCRNQYVAHISNASLNISVFNNLWSLLEPVLCRLAFDCGQEFLDDVKSELLHLRECEFDALQERNVWVNMISWCMSGLQEDNQKYKNQTSELLVNQKYMNQNVELLENSIQNNFEAVQKQLQSHVDKVENNVQNQSLQLSEIKKKIDETFHTGTGRTLPQQAVVMQDRSVQVEPDVISPTGKKCYDPSELIDALGESPLEDQTDDLAVYRLRRNCETAGMQFLGKTPGDGNCFFEAVSSQLNRLSLPRRSARELRATVVQFLLNNRAFQGPDGTIFLEGFVQGNYEDYCLRMSREGEYADHVAVIGMARMLELDVMIVTSSPGTGPDESIIWVVGKDNFDGNPLLLAHIWENHYESLEQKCSINRRLLRSTGIQQLVDEPTVHVEGTGKPLSISPGEDGIICVTKHFSTLKTCLVDETIIRVAEFILEKGLLNRDEFERITDSATMRRRRSDLLLKKIILGKSELLICFFDALKSHCRNMAIALAGTEITDEDRRKHRNVKKRAIEDKKGDGQQRTGNKLQDVDIRFFQLNLCGSPDVVDLINDAMLSNFVFSVLDHSLVIEREGSADKIYTLLDKLRSYDLDPEAEFESIMDRDLYKQWIDSRKERRILDVRRKNLAQSIGINFRTVCRTARKTLKNMQHRLRRGLQFEPKYIQEDIGQIYMYRLLSSGLLSEPNYIQEDIGQIDRYLIFLSFSSFDEEFIIREIKPELDARFMNSPGYIDYFCCGVFCFLPGKLIVDEIHRCFSCSEVIVFIVTEAFMDSQWARLEISIAVSMGKPIMYLLMDNITKSLDGVFKVCKYRNFAILSAKNGKLKIKPDWNKVCNTILKLKKISLSHSKMSTLF